MKDVSGRNKIMKKKKYYWMEMRLRYVSTQHSDNGKMETAGDHYWGRITDITLE